MCKITKGLTDGRGYKALRAALIRLQGMQIETNISTGGTEQHDIFSIIDRARIIRETRDGRMQEIEVELSDWVFNAILTKPSSGFASNGLKNADARKVFHETP